MQNFCVKIGTLRAQRVEFIFMCWSLACIPLTKRKKKQKKKLAQGILPNNTLRARLCHFLHTRSVCLFARARAPRHT